MNNTLEKTYPLMKKTYDAQMGVAIDGNFYKHVANGCDQCKRFDAEKPDTLALLCLEGSVLWKNHEPVRRQQDWRPKSHVSKEVARRAMKYKE